MQQTLGIITVILAFVGYIPYLRDTFLGKTKPHVISWFLWTIVSFLAFGLQWSKGGGAGSYANFAMGVICLILFVKSIKSGTKNVKTIDIVSLILAIIAIVLWLIVDLPVLSIILVVLIDFLSFVPTFVKSWNNPSQETLSTWILSVVRHALVIMSLQNINIVTALFPIYALIVNSIFCGELVYRRKILQKKSNPREKVA